MMKKLLLESAIPARALYQAKKAARRAKKLSCLDDAGGGGAVSANKVADTGEQEEGHVEAVKKREKNATVERRVQISRMKVKMNSALLMSALSLYS